MTLNPPVQFWARGARALRRAEPTNPNPATDREPIIDTSRREAISLSGWRAASHAAIGIVLVALVAGCAGAASESPSRSPGGLRSEAAAKEALLAHFGPLVYCDPDFYPVARVDEASAAAEHLAEMRADTTTWAAIAAHQGLNPSAAPSGEALLAVYREWKMLRALALVPAGNG